MSSLHTPTPGYWTLAYTFDGVRRYCVTPPKAGEAGVQGPVTSTEPRRAQRFSDAEAARAAYGDYSGFIIADLVPHFVEDPDEPLRLIAVAWAREHSLPENRGWVLFFHGDIAGWVPNINDPAAFVPGCKAIALSLGCTNSVTRGGFFHSSAARWLRDAERDEAGFVEFTREALEQQLKKTRALNAQLLIDLESERESLRESHRLNGGMDRERQRVNDELKAAAWRDWRGEMAAVEPGAHRLLREWCAVPELYWHNVGPHNWRASWNNLEIGGYSAEPSVHWSGTYMMFGNTKFIGTFRDEEESRAAIYSKFLEWVKLAAATFTDLLPRVGNEPLLAQVTSLSRLETLSRRQATMILELEGARDALRKQLESEVPA